MGCVRCRVRQTAVVGSQKRLTRCFRELEVASQQHKKTPKNRKKKILHISLHAREPCTMATSPMQNGFHQKLAVLQADTIEYFGHLPETCTKEKITKLRSRESWWVVNPPKRAKIDYKQKAPDSGLYVAFFSENLEIRILCAKSHTLIFHAVRILSLIHI